MVTPHVLFAPIRGRLPAIYKVTARQSRPTFDQSVSIAPTSASATVTPLTMASP
jgi:hypothetical protein